MIEKISKQLAAGFWVLVAFALPVVAMAQTGGVPSQGGATGGLSNVVNEAGRLIQALIPLVIGLAVLVFIWGVLRYVLASDDAGKAQGRTFMLWGIIALFVMVSVWGLVNILRQTLQLDTQAPPAPAIPSEVR